MNRQNEDGYRSQHKDWQYLCIWLATGSLLLVGPLVSGRAFAQLAPQGQGRAAAEEDALSLGEIVVTATKRSSTVQDTPIAITALTGDELHNNGITSVDTLIGEVPGISMKSNGPGQTEFEMRGLSSNGGSSPTVGFYLDEAPLTSPAASLNGKVAIDPNLYDVDRIEVLRGPQGTLYGSGSMGGTIKVITRQPDLTDNQASVDTTLSGTEGGGVNSGGNAMVNIPIVDGMLALRVVGSVSDTSGWIDRIVITDFPVATNSGLTRGNVLASPVIADHHDVNDEHLGGIRAALLFKPNDRLSISPSMFYQKISQGGPSDYDSVPGTLAHYTPFDVPEPITDRVLVSDLVVTYKADSFDVTSATANWNRTETISQDEAENIQQGFGLPSVYPADGGIGGGNFVEQDKSRQFSEELRLTSSGDTRYQWIGGFYYSDFTSSWDDTAIMPDAVPLFGTDEQYVQVQPTNIKQKALFGEASYKITDKLSGTLGLRVYRFDTTVSTLTAGFGSATGTAEPSSAFAMQSNQGASPKFNLSYEAAKDVLTYATVARGFRPGGGNLPVSTTPTTVLGLACLADLAVFGKTSAPLTYNSDTVWSYEVGEKAALFEDRLTLNSAAYYETWNRVQQIVPLNCGYDYTDNVGKAKVHGAELELHAKLTAQLTWINAVSYTDAYLAQNNPETGGKEGDQLQAIAPWTGSSALSYSVPASNNWVYTGHISYDYVGPRIDATFYPMNHLAGYSLINTRVGLVRREWTVSLFVDNLTNTRAKLSDTPSFSLNLPSYNRVATNQPLTGGVNIAFQFK
jgi:iron complex outermembrane receptor protein